MAKTAGARKTVPQTANDLLINAVIKGIQEKKGKKITILNLESLSGAVAGCFVICNGDSSTQVEAIARSVEEFVFRETNEWPAHIEGVQNAQWVLIDYFNIIVHIFQKEQREYYGIERLWADAHIREIPD